MACTMTMTVSPSMEPTSKMMAARFGHHHRESISEVPDSDGIAVGVEDVICSQAVPKSRWGDDGVITHAHNTTCETFTAQDLAGI